MQAADNSSSEKTSILKSTREARGLTLELVHEATKIPMDALKAIEEGYSVRLLSPFYYRGFIKIYAEFLGLDVAEMYKQYGLDPTPKSASPMAVPVKSNREPAGPNIFLGQVQEGFSLIFKPKTFTLILKIIGFLILLFLLIKMGGCAASQISHMWQGKKVKVHREAGQKYAVVAAQGINHGALQAPSQDNKVEVAVRASQDIWLKVKADDHVVFQSTLSKRSMESWNADERIELSGRDIELLDMEVNGKQFGFLGGGDRRIRKVLITPEGLTVKK